MEQRLNVLFISSWFPTAEKPTRGNFVESHAEASACYHNVNVVHVSKSNIQKKYEIVERTSGSIQIQNLYFKPSHTRIKILDQFKDICLYIKYYNRLFSKLTNKPDIVHANVIFPIGLIALFFKYRYGVKFILTEHWSIYQKENRFNIGFFKKQLFKWVAKKASLIMPVSEQLKIVMQETGLLGSYQVVPNTINSDIFKNKHQVKTNCFNWIHISTLREEVKNPKGILRAYKCLLDSHDNVHLKIVSDGNIKSSQQYAEEIGIPSSKISFIRTQTTEQIATHLNNSNAFILFSNFENLPLVIIESFACGIPVISTDVGGIKERFPNEFGILIEKKDENALLKAMQNLMANYEVYNSELISEYAIRTFSYETVGSIFSDVYKQVTNPD